MVMSNVLNDYKGYILLGGGVMADRLAPQLMESKMELLGVADNMDEHSRKIKKYKDL